MIATTAVFSVLLGIVPANAALQPFTGISQLVSTGPVVCLLDQTLGLSCFGDDSFTPAFQAMTPSLKGITVLAAGGGRFCAAHSAGVTCWDPVSTTAVAAETQPIMGVTRLAVTSKNACAVTASGTQCWGDAASGINEVPSTLTHPTALALNGVNACAIQDNAYLCWGQGFGFGGWPPTTPRSQKLTAIRPGNLTIYTTGFCAAGDQGIECFGEDNGLLSYDTGNFTALTDGICGLTADKKILCGFAEYTDPTQNYDGNYTSLVGDLGDIREIAGTAGYCAASANQVKCYGQAIHVPVTPTDGVSTYTADGERCAVDQDGIKCFGPHSAGASAPLVAPTGIRKLVSDGEATCALTGGVPVCWGGTYRDPARSDLTHVEDGFFYAKGYDRGFCAIQDGHVLCASRYQGGTGVEAIFELTDLAGFDKAFPASAYQTNYYGLKGKTVTCFYNDFQTPSSLNLSLPDVPTWVEGLEGYDLCAIRSLVNGTLRVDRPGQSAALEIPDVRDGSIHRNITDAGLSPTLYAAYVTSEGQLVCSTFDLSTGTKTGALNCPTLAAPHEIRPAKDGFCAIDQGRLVCWTYGKDSAHQLTVTDY